MMYFNLSTENKKSVMIIIIIIIITIAIMIIIIIIITIIMAIMIIIIIIIVIVISFQTKQSFKDFIPNMCSKKFRNIHRKTPVLESL